MRPGSLRRRISVAVVGITSGVVLVGALASWFALRASLYAALDRELESRLERLGRIAIAVQHHAPPWMDPRGDQRRMVQVFDAASGAELLRTAAVPEGRSLAPPGIPRSGGPRDVQAADGWRARVLTVPLPPPPPPPDGFRRRSSASAARPPPPPPPIPATSASAAVACLGIELEPTDAELTRMARLLALLWAGATLLALAAVLALGGAILRPLGRLTAALDRLGPEDLAARLDGRLGPAELGAMVDRLNLLLDRLEQAFRREQATIAAIAHELRTPVAGLRSALEFRRRSLPAGAEAEALDGYLRTVERMQAMVADLLLLARIEAGRETLQPAEADLSALVQDAWEERAAQVTARALRLEGTWPEEARLLVSAEHLRLLVGNLVGNAVAHAPAGAALRVELASRSGGWRLELANPLAGPLDASQLGKPFYRGDRARSEPGHCGLGLALCQRLARLIGARLAISATDGVFRAELLLGDDLGMTGPDLQPPPRPG